MVLEVVLAHVHELTSGLPAPWDEDAHWCRRFGMSERRCPAPAGSRLLPALDRSGGGSLRPRSDRTTEQRKISAVLSEWTCVAVLAVTGEPCRRAPATTSKNRRSEANHFRADALDQDDPAGTEVGRISKYLSSMLVGDDSHDRVGSIKNQPKGKYGSTRPKGWMASPNVPNRWLRSPHLHSFRPLALSLSPR